ncbi:hypothetical protein FNF27_03363 [Cafeteria roenbergensis]|uniref:Uncharacterized protein n=1 Tax=Cafeteria roenbergensis TaxID=33653 RepID=A0A5A8EB64_CAFRO|nr:hypothetical protein FNF27_03363 [Cafeteria roenbergensis]
MDRAIRQEQEKALLEETVVAGSAGPADLHTVMADMAETEEKIYKAMAAANAGSQGSPSASTASPDAQALREELARMRRALEEQQQLRREAEAAATSPSAERLSEAKGRLEATQKFRQRDKAATALQARARGLLARRQSRAMLVEHKEQTAAAVKVQAGVRGALARRQSRAMLLKKQLQEEERRASEAAIKLQANVRGTLARRRSRVLLLERQLREAEEQKQRHAAVRMQAGVRGALARRQSKAMLLERQLQEEEEQRQRHAAVRVQAGVRGALARRQSKAMLLERQLQEEVEREHRRASDAAVKVQAGVRGALARRQSRAMLLERRLAEEAAMAERMEQAEARSRIDAAAALAVFSPDGTLPTGGIVEEDTFEDAPLSSRAGDQPDSDDSSDSSSDGEDDEADEDDGEAGGFEPGHQYPAASPAAYGGHMFGQQPAGYGGFAGAPGFAPHQQHPHHAYYPQQQQQHQQAAPPQPVMPIGTVAMFMTQAGPAPFLLAPGGWIPYTTPQQAAMLQATVSPAGSRAGFGSGAGGPGGDHRPRGGRGSEGATSDGSAFASDLGAAPPSSTLDGRTSVGRTRSEEEQEDAEAEARREALHERAQDRLARSRAITGSQPPPEPASAAASPGKASPPPSLPSLPAKGTPALPTGADSVATKPSQLPAKQRLEHTGGEAVAAAPVPEPSPELIVAQEAAAAAASGMAGHAAQDKPKASPASAVESPVTGAEAAAQASRGKRAPVSGLGSFMYVKNTRRKPGQEVTPDRPRYWVGRVTELSRDGVYKMHWFRETELGSSLYQPTNHYFRERVQFLRPFKLVTLEKAARAWRCFPPIQIKGDAQDSEGVAKEASAAAQAAAVTPDEAAADPDAERKETASMGPDVDGDGQPMAVGAFVFLRNGRFDSSRETASNPRYWVARVCNSAPQQGRPGATPVPPRMLDAHGRARLQWFKETAIGSGLYVEMEQTFHEPRSRFALVPGGLRFNESANLWMRQASPSQGHKILPLVFPGDEGLLAEELEAARRGSTPASTVAGGSGPGSPMAPADGADSIEASAVAAAPPSGPAPIITSPAEHPCVVDSFCFVPNHNFKSKRESASNPRFIVAQIRAVSLPTATRPASATVCVFKEEMLHSRLYVPVLTGRSVFREPLGKLKPLPAMVFDAPRNAWRLTGAFNLGARFEEPTAPFDGPDGLATSAAAQAPAAAQAGSESG